MTETLSYEERLARSDVSGDVTAVDRAIRHNAVREALKNAMADLLAREFAWGYLSTTSRDTHHTRYVALARELRDHTEADATKNVFYRAKRMAIRQYNVDPDAFAVINEDWIEGENDD